MMPLIRQLDGRNNGELKEQSCEACYYGYMAYGSRVSIESPIESRPDLELLLCSGMSLEFP